ncbi:secretion ATPase, PEP-CTERM locus subfamily [Desulfovibrio sp. X2]|uniref:XrtA/PEP-CTERM system-associated ATPase n=1 Tax=Desulfovibrio sp. X2 TaxID=941449 RepID=UPI00035899B3|nr:XrtA/PEP-CTERM system-associated ATPase [Desulfovibrio sp. X2]EPR37245.1 secretion ATPase, PEP-CTERM locus subfamily [Desulfovibrio sp. X2]
MYTSFFGLREKPFDLLPNPDFLFPSQAHKRALTYLSHGIRERVGFILLTGEVGSGKTTIIRNLIRKQLQNISISKVFNTKVDSHQLLAMINDDFGLPTEGKDKVTLIRELNEYLIGQYATGKMATLIIDEAQNLSQDLLEEIRMLSNLETDREKLLQIILVGQPELRKTLSSPALLQLRQRIQINCHIHPLSPAEVEEYILYRLEKAGNKEALNFEPGSMDAIHTYTRGVPRLINILCDYILLDAFASQSTKVTPQTINELAQDLSFDSQYWESTSPEGAAPANGEANVAEDGAGAQTDPVAATTQAVRTASKLNALVRDLSQRVSSLEATQYGEPESVLEVRQRLDEIEKNMDAKLRAVWMALQKIRTELNAPRMTQTQFVPDPPEIKKSPGTMRLIWNFLWGE